MLAGLEQVSLSPGTAPEYLKGKRDDQQGTPQLEGREVAAAASMRLGGWPDVR